MSERSGRIERIERIVSTVLLAHWCASPQMVMAADECMVDQ
jgi:hypothetical protein